MILTNGKLKEGDTIVVAGIEGPIVTQIRALLTPQPLKELRVKNQYISNKELPAAQGVKIAAKDLEKALAGIPLFVAQQPDEVDYWKVSHNTFNNCSWFVIICAWRKRVCECLWFAKKKQQQNNVYLPSTVFIAQRLVRPSKQLTETNISNWT